MLAQLGASRSPNYRELNKVNELFQDTQVRKSILLYRSHDLHQLLDMTTTLRLYLMGVIRASKYLLMYNED